VLTTLNPAAMRMLDLDPSVVGRHHRGVFGSEPLAGLARLLGEAFSLPTKPVEEEIDLVAAGHELHLAVYITSLSGTEGDSTGLVLVLDDLTQLLRAQKAAAWREVARRLAHEIKNPLTPIQLSAQRIGKHFRAGSAELPRVVEECTRTIVEEVEALKTLVDEFSQFARMPGVAAVVRPLNPLVEAALGLYDGLFKELRLEKRLAPDVPDLRVDPELIRRVLINVLDNAIEATSGNGHIVVSTRYDAEAQVAHVAVEDDGPGIPIGDRDKLFLPYFSTKRRGSGLGLAIVSRIVAEHRGRVRVEDREPHGTRFIIELPVASKPVEVV
jgi:two-component system nitrogen regulation sensor histidine kinase NtrY